MKLSIKSFPKILFVTAILVVAVQGISAQLTIEPTTWNVIGLDSNKVNDGPNRFPVGVEVCNVGGTTVNNVTATFVWDSSNIYINLEGGSTINLSSLDAGKCTGAYFMVLVTRNSSAHDTTRGYHITVTGDGAGTVSTPTPRELYVEKLVSQARNSVNSISGPSTVYVGGTYTYTLSGNTATNGYEQLETFLTFPSSVFQTLSIATTYTAPTGGTNDKFYADACGWDNDPGSPDYRSCIGPNQYAGGKAGGLVNVTYTVKVVGAGTSVLTPLIYDFSGSSYHYNSDFIAKEVTVQAFEPPALSISKSHTGDFTRGQTGANYTITVSNTGGAATTGTVTVADTLPTGLTPTGPTGTVNGWNCSIGGQTLTCTRSDSLAAGSSYPSITLSVNVAANAPSSITNIASAYGGGDVLHDTAANAVTASDPTTIRSSPRVSLSKSCPVPADCTTANQLPDTELTYQIDFNNTGQMNATGLIITDGVPANTDYKVGSASADPGTTGLTFVIEYSNDYDPSDPVVASWNYTPVNEGGGADPGFDRLVRAIRWRVTAGSLPFTAPDNSGGVSFIVKIQ